MVELILFITLGIGILIAFEIRARKQTKDEANPSAEGDLTANAESGLTGKAGLSGAQPQSFSPQDGPSDGCCGSHLVCERETLLQTNAEIVYYDDEELDAFAGIAPEEYTKAQHDTIADVFHTLQEKDVPGWCRSLQLRHIELPLDLREEALLIVRERRSQKLS